MDTHTYTHTLDMLLHVRAMYAHHMRMYVQAYLARDTPTMGTHHAMVQHYAVLVSTYEATVHTMVHA